MTFSRIAGLVVAASMAVCLPLPGFCQGGTEAERSTKQRRVRKRAEKRPINGNPFASAAIPVDVRMLTRQVDTEFCVATEDLWFAGSHYRNQDAAQRGWLDIINQIKAASPGYPVLVELFSLSPGPVDSSPGYVVLIGFDRQYRADMARRALPLTKLAADYSAIRPLARYLAGVLISPSGPTASRTYSSKLDACEILPSWIGTGDKEPAGRPLKGQEKRPETPVVVTRTGTTGDAFSAAQFQDGYAFTTYSGPAVAEDRAKEMAIDAYATFFARTSGDNILLAVFMGQDGSSGIVTVLRDQYASYKAGKISRSELKRNVVIVPDLAKLRSLVDEMEADDTWGAMYGGQPAE